MNEEYKQPCKYDIKDCPNHKYHCGKCNTGVSYSPANYASRPTDIPNQCEYCKKQPDPRMGVEIKEIDVKEIIICAAIRMSDGYIVRGHRHCDAILTASKIPRYKEESHRFGDDQGFVTSFNRYVNRIEAAKIQKEAGIKSKMPEGQEYLHGECYSEDLY